MYSRAALDICIIIITVITVKRGIIVAKPIVTEDLVSEAADAIAASGEDPSIISVQARIGGGSYTTVKRYLDLWRQQQARPPIPEPPATIAERGAALTRDLWAAAQALADEQVAQAREVARRQVEEARKAQAGAEAAVEQLETQLEEQAHALAERDQLVATLRQELARAQAEVSASQARAEEVQRQAQELRANLDRLQAGERAEVAALAAEVAALKSQVAQALASRSPRHGGDK